MEPQFNAWEAPSAKPTTPAAPPQGFWAQYNSKQCIHAGAAGVAVGVGGAFLVPWVSKKISIGYYKVKDWIKKPKEENY